MNNRQRNWTWLAAAFSFVVGLIFVWNDSAAGWFMIIVGLGYIGSLAQVGQAGAASSPSLARWGVIGGTLLFILLVVVAGAVLL